MPLDDDLSGGLNFTPESVLNRVQRSVMPDLPDNVSGEAILNRLNRKLTELEGRRRGEDAPIETPAAPAMPAKPKASKLDFSDQGIPASDLPDLSSEGIPIDAVPLPAPRPAGAPGPVPTTSFSDYPLEFGKGLVEGAKNMPAAALKGLAVHVPDAGAQPDYDALGNPLGTNNAVEIGAVPAAMKDRTMFKAGQSIENFGKDTLAPRPGFEPGKSWTRDIGSGAGSMLAGVGMSMVPGIGPAAAGAMFTLSGSGEAVDNAIKGGATTSEAERAGMIGGVAGATDMVDTLLPFLGGTGKALGFLKRVGVAAVKGAMMEGGQEGVQQLIQNGIAKGIYKPDQDMFEDVPRSMAIAAILGGSVGGLSGAAHNGQQPTAPAPGTPPPAGGAQPGAQAGPQPGAGPQPSGGPQAGPSSPEDIADFLRRAKESAPPQPEAEWTPPNPRGMSEKERMNAYDAARESHGGARQDDILRSTGLDDDAIAAMDEQDKIDSVIRATKRPEGASQENAAPKNEAGPENGAGNNSQAEQPQAKAAEPADDSYSVLRAYGYSDADIEAMSPRQRAREAMDARAEGIDPAEAAKKYPPASPTAEKGAGNPAGTRTAPLDGEIIPPGKAGQFDQQPWTAADGNPWGMSDADYAVWKKQPENAEAVAQWNRDNKIIDHEGDGTRSAPIVASTADHIRKALPTAPTEAQAEAENYKHAHVELPHLGLTGRNNISVETGIGQDRKGVDADGKPWSVTMRDAAYGRIKGTKGADGEALDIFIGPEPTSAHVFVVDQHHPGGKGFDEHKIMTGFPTPQAALEAYGRAYADGGGDRIGGVTALTPDQFKDWIKSGDTAKPLMSGKTVDVGDTGQNVPETRATLKAQQNQLIAGERAVQMFPEGTRELPLPPGMERTSTERGTFHFDPKKTTAAYVQELSRAKRENELLGLGSIAKADVMKREAAGEKPVTIVERNADGVEVRAAAGTESTAEQQRAELDKGKSPGNTVAIERTAKTIAKRKEGNRPLSLLQFIASRGGIRPDPELSALDLDHHHRVQIPGRRGFFSVVKPGGMAHDRMREAAQEAGYFPNTDVGTSTLRDFYDAIDGELRGHRKYAEGFEGTRTKAEDQSADESSEHYRQQAIDFARADILSNDPGIPNDVLDVAATIAADENLSPDDALEQAFIRYLDEDGNRLDVTPAELSDNYEGLDHEIQAARAREDGGASGTEGDGQRRPGESQEAKGDGKQPAASGQTSGKERSDKAGADELGEEYDPSNEGDASSPDMDPIYALAEKNGPTHELTSMPLEKMFPAPAKTVRPSTGEILTQAQADARIQSWKDHAARIGREEDHSNEVILSLFDRTGEWSKPYRDAGYRVVQYDITNGDDLVRFVPTADILAIEDAGLKVVGVLTAPPCTSYAVSGARWWEDQHDKANVDMVAKKYGGWATQYFDTPLEYANTLVATTQLVIEFAKPSQFHVLENPVGRIQRMNGLPAPTLSFNPNHYGNPYTKKTLLWGDFNADLPTAHVEATEGSKIHKLRGDNPEQKLQRSETPEGFAYAFFMANNTSKLKFGEATTEAGADGKAQTVIPGAEKIGDGELAQRKTDASLKPKVAQKDVGGLFGDIMDQVDLLDMIPKHIEAVETALGDDAGKVAPVDIARAAEIMAENEGMDVPTAFGQAVAETTVQQGFITEQQAVDAYGEEIKHVLEAGREGASGRSGDVEQERAESGEVRPGDAAQAGVAAGGGETVRAESAGEGRADEAAAAPETAKRPAAADGVAENESATKAADNAELTDEEWWNALTPFGRKQALNETGIYTTDTIKWRSLNKNQQSNLASFRNEVAATEAMDKNLSNLAGSMEPLTQAERDERAARPAAPGWFEDVVPNLPLNARGRPDVKAFDKIASEVAGKPGIRVRFDELTREQKIEAFDRLKQEAARKAARDAPTWAEIMAALPKDAAGHKDSELAFRLMSEITGTRNPSFRDMLPAQQVELLDALRGAKGEPDGVSAPVSRGNAAAESEDVSAPAGQQRAGAALGVEGARSSEDVPGDSIRGTAAADGTEPAGSRGTDASGDVPVSGRDDTEAGRAERASVKRASAGVVGENYHIEPGSLGEGRGPKAKAQDNIAAIKLANRLTADGATATAAEQAQLAAYVGWGGLKGAFPDADGNFAKGFEKIGAEVADILTPAEYETARRSIQYAHYTAETVISSMWSAAEQMGFKGGKVFEPGMGVGHFAGLMPSDIAANTSYSGVEMDHVTARIAKLLYPRWGVRREDFTRMPLAENAFDLAIGNPPFADIAIKSDPKYAQQGFLLHDYFFAKSLDGVRPGGLLMFVTSAGTMNKLDPSARKYLADRANLVGAIRLPGNAFKENAGTEVTTDIVILRKLMPGETAGDQSWTQTANVTLPGPDGKPTTGQISRYFADNPDMVLGEGDFADKLYEGRYSVKAPKGFDLRAELAKAIANLPANVMQDAETATQRAEVDFSGTEAKDGSYYVKDGVLMQQRDGAGYPVASRGKGVAGRTAAEIERIRGLIPIRDALRDTFAADLAENLQDGQKARARLNEAYDAFVAKFGPINKAEISYRRPSTIQQEAARAEAREEARYADERFDEGSFDPSAMIEAGKSLNEIARARAEAREKLGDAYREGSFDPEQMPDIIMDKRPNIAPFADDQENYRLRAIEHYDAPTGRAEKSPVFFKNIITKDRAPDIKSIGDATMFVMNQTGKLDLDAIGAMVGKSRTETIEALGDRIYQVPGADGTWETREKYLSGNVRKKLVLAEAAARKNPALRRNVDALEAAQPAALAPSQIGASLGMPWIPQEVVSQFGTEALGLEKFKATYSPAIASWSVVGDTDSVASVTTWGTSRRNATALIGDVLNRQSPKIYDQVDNDTRVLNQIATQAAQEKMQAIRDRFNEWVFGDEKRADRLATYYNENYNNLVVQEFDGGYLTTPGIADGWSWRPHQKRVVARIIQNGNTYMAHAVGAGKTSAMIGAGMEMRRLGLVKKPMYAVPNHMLGQFTKEFYEQYPTARIMVADDRQFHTDRRKQFMANVAVSDLDAVIITHSSFGMIPLSAEFKDGIIQQEIANYRAALAEVPSGGDNRITRSRIEKQIERLEQRLSGRSNRKADAVFTFDEMGVDFLFVDEAHMFRKLDFTTQMSNLKGVTPEGSGAAWDLFMKSKLLEQRNPGRSLVLASGTPVTNTMAELFTVSRYLQMQELQDRGLSQFDAWAGAFGENVTELEQDAAGGYKPVSRFARFVNVAELSAMVRQVMDVVTSRQLEQYVVRPQIKGGKRKLHLAEQSPELEAYNRSLAARMKAMEGRGKPQPGDDIMLKVIGDGRHAAIDMRLVTGGQGGGRTNTPSKLDMMIDNSFGIWKASKEQKFYKPLKGGGGYDMSKAAAVGPATQMIFTNLGVSGSRGFAVPDYIRSELVRRGVPRAEIALIGDFKNHVAKQKLFNDMNEGKVRFLIGSVAKMGTGVNAQRRLYAIHNLDPLWYPSDDEQRNGRALRQGNMNPEIEINDYAAKGTYDSTMWGMMEKKARFIQGFFEGDPSLRSMDDLGEASQYEQAKAMTTNDPRLMKLTDMRQELEKANRRKAAFDNDRYAIRQRRANEKSSLEYYEARAIQIEKDIAQRVPLAGDKFTAKIGRTSYDKRVDFGDALLKQLDNLATKENSGKEFPVGEISGFSLVATPQKMGDEVAVNVDLKRNGGAATHVTVGTSGLGAVRSMESILAGFDGELSNARSRASTARKFLSESENDASKKFTGGSDMETLASEIRALQAELSAKKEEPAAVADDDGSIASALARGELSQTAEEAIPQIEAMLDSIVKMIAGPFRTEFSRKPFQIGQANGYGTVAPTLAGAMYIPSKALIRIALVGNADEAARRAFHESYHAIEDRLQTEAERELMKRETERLRLYLKQKKYKGYTPAQIDSLAGFEIRAMAFEEYTFNKLNNPETAGAGVHIGVRRWFERLWLALRKLANGLRKLGFQTYEDIFNDARAGKFARRAASDENNIDLDSMASAINMTRNGPQARETVAELLEDRSMFRLAKLSRSIGVGRHTLGNVNAIGQRAYWQDRFIRVKRAEDSVDANLPSRLSAYQAESLYYGRTGEQLETLEKETFDPLIEDMKDRDISLEGINEYLYAKHAPERNARMDEINHPELMPGSRDLSGRGSGMSDEEAQAVMDRITAEGKMADYQAVEARIRQIINDTRAGLVDSGLISQDTADKWAQQYDFYVPLQGFAEGTEDETYSGGKGRGYDIRGKETKQAFGRLSRADGPLPYIMQQAEMAIVRGEKNRVGNAWLRFVQSNPDAARWTVDRPPLVKTIDNATGLVTMMADPFWKNRDDVFATKVGGRPVLIQMHGQDGENLARALKNMGAENLNQMLRFTRTVTTTMSRLATQWNPNFIIPNLVRDLGEAYINLQAQDQDGFIKAFTKHLRPAISGSFKALSGKGDQNNRYVRAFKEFDAAGGRIRFFGLDNAVDIGASVDRKLRRLEGGALNGAKDAGRSLVEAFEWVNGSMENATRLAAFMAARDVGMSPADAAMLARNLTVDFNKKGEAAGWMNALYMFSNVAFQGARRNLTALNNKHVRRAAYGLIAMGALSAALGFLGGDDDDAGENRYSRVPAWDRDKNFIFMLPGGGYIKIPLPFGFAMFKVLGDRMAGVALGKDKPGAALTHILKSIGDSFSPLGEESSSLFSIFPSALRPAVHIESNKNWNGRSIYPTYDFQKNRPDSEQAFPNTSAAAKAAAQKINAASGGSPYKSGWADWHPGSIQHVFESLTGGLGKFVLDTTGTIKRGFTGDKFDPTQAPIIRRFYGDTASPQSENARFYELREEARKNGGDAIKQARKDRGRGPNKDAAEAFLSDNKNSIRNEELFKAADRQLKPLRNRRELIENDEDMSRADRRAALDDITEKMRAIQNRTRKRYLENKRESAQ